MKVKDIIKFFADEENIVAQDVVIRLHFFTEDEYAKEITYSKDYYSYKYSSRCVSFRIYEYDSKYDEVETIYNFIHTEESENHDTVYVDCQVITEC